MKKLLKYKWLILFFIVLIPVAWVFIPTLLKQQKSTVPFVGSDQTRGVKNNNPLNLRRTNIDWKGERSEIHDKDFEEFESMVLGLRAGIRNMRTWFNRGNQSIIKLIHIWAPPEDANDTEAYVSYVAEQSGIPYDAVFEWEKDVVYKIVKAMCKIESQFDCSQKLFNDAWEQVD